MPTQDPTTGLRLDNQFAREVQGMYVNYRCRSRIYFKLYGAASYLSTPRIALPPPEM
jgi:hypothetical protein